MKVLHIINSFEQGGAEKLALQLHQLSIERGIDSHALSICHAEHIDIPSSYCLGLKTPYSFTALLHLFNFLKKEQNKDVDIIHVHLFPAQFLVPIATKVLGIQAPLVTTEHSTNNRRRGKLYGKLIDQLVYRFYTQIACISDGSYKSLAEWLPRFKNKLRIVHNGINLASFTSTEVSSNHSYPILFSAGRLIAVKNYEKVLRALSHIDTPFEFWIAGSGPLEKKLQEVSKELDLHQKVHFLGFRRDIPQLMKKADIFLQVSQYEGFGLAAAEAMASGLPVIASRVPGLSEVVEESKQVGLLVNPDDVKEIANSIKLLISNSEHRKELGRNAVKHAQNFSIERMTDSYIDLYKAVLS